MDETRDATPATDGADQTSAELTDQDLELLNSMFDLARDGGTERLAAFLDAGLPVNLTNGKGDTLLILAAYHQHADTVAALLARDAETERVNDMGQTALAAAVFRQNETIVRALLGAGADPHGGRQTPVSVAEYFQLPAMAELLRGAGDQTTGQTGQGGGRTTETAD
ncbi:ankyrin repeat domain-containing protein [Tersicoccus sp. MR15.9]|uniref:ankyrin repeat domain-containing protein n=1 Tax=Tersicoccus mangrovi TaxID=3121635 RepID=UPI002FE55751